MTRNFKREDLSTLDERHTSSLGLALGYEWQNLLARRWKWYYGGEVQGKLTWDNSVGESEFFDENTNELVDRREVTKRRTDQIALLPFAGIRFHITPYLFLSTEVKIEASYEKSKYRGDTYWTWPDGSVAKPFSEFSIVNKNISFQPYTGLFINLIL